MYTQFINTHVNYCEPRTFTLRVAIIVVARNYVCCIMFKKPLTESIWTTVNLAILAEKYLVFKKLLTCWRILILVIGSSLKIVNDIHSRLFSSYDVKPLPFTLPYLQKSSLVTH